MNLGAENSKHLGKRSGVYCGVSYFWDCCDCEDPKDKGCTKGRHISYDDSTFNNILVNRL